MLGDAKITIDEVSLYFPELLENDIKELRTLLEKHVRYTESALAKFILDNWQMQVSFFLKVIPLEYKKALARIKNTENCYAESISGTEEVYPLY